MPTEEDEIVHSGRMKFKAGLINKWSTVYCIICEGVLNIYETTDTEPDPLFVFTSHNSWISAKRSNENTLFVLNATESNSAASKIFLFDTESADLLHLWLQAFRTAGWSSAIMGEKLHYHKRSVGTERSSQPRVYRETAFGGSLRGTRTQSEPTFFVTGRPTVGTSDLDSGHNRHWIGPRRRTNLSSVFSDIDISSKNYSTEPTPVKILNPKDLANSNHKNINQFETISKDHILIEKEPNGILNEQTMRKSVTETNEKVRRSNSAKIVRVNQFEVFQQGSDRKRTNTVGAKPVSQKYDSNFESKNAYSNVNESAKSDPINIKHSLRPSRNGRFDHSKIFFDPTLSPDMKGKLLQAESRSRKTSLTRQGKHIRLSESDENEQLLNAASRESPENHKTEEISDTPREIEVTNIDTGEQEIVNDLIRARKCSSVASEGVADLNLDVDSDSNVFHPGTQGPHFSYLESGYCSKESLSTNESLDHQRSSVTNFDDLNNNNNSNSERFENDNENENHNDSRTCLQQKDDIAERVHNSIKPSSANKNGRVSDGTAGGAEIAGSYSEKVTMTPRLTRPGNMKLEKRSSMSQLLAQLKDRLPGWKSRGPKRVAKKDQIGSEGTEPVLWNNNGKWKERWYALCESCLLLYKDAAYRAPDFALDVRGCKLEIPTENHEQGFLGFMLVEKDGKTQEFAAVTEESYKYLISRLTIIGQGGRHSDSDLGVMSDNEETDAAAKEAMTLDDAIIPYSESEEYPEGNQITSEKRGSKQESIDSGTDGDISCFEGSDASNVGIDQYASGWKDKMLRRRKTSLVLPQPVIINQPESNNVDSANGSKGPVADVRRSHRKVVHCESSPPSPRSANVSLIQAIDSLNPNSREMLRPIDYLNVEDQRRLPRNRHSMPVLIQKLPLRDDEFNRQRRSCLEELLKLKEAHENNQYSGKTGKTDKRRATSLYYGDNNIAVVDENDNHLNLKSWSRSATSSPKRAGSFKTDASPNTRLRSTPTSRNRHRSMIVGDRSVNLPHSFSDQSDFTDEYPDDLQQQTLLMKRRNSLRLQRDVVDQKVKALQERLHRNSTEDPETEEEERNLSLLQNRLSNIEKELIEINEKADMPPEDIFKEKKKKQQLFSKFKGTQKTEKPLQAANQKTSNQKEGLDSSITSPNLSPRVRKRSFTHNFKMFGASKRDSDLRDSNSNRESISSLESSVDGSIGYIDSAGKRTGSLADLKNPDDHKLETRRPRKTSSVCSVSEIDEVDGVDQGENSKDSPDLSETGISKDALSKIEEFEKFAVEMTAKKITDYVDV